MREDRGVKIDVRDNQIEPALKGLKKLMVKTGLF
jgi:ribosomal protein S21